MRIRLTVGNRLFAVVLSLFVIFGVILIVFQQTREEAHNVQVLNLKLQNFNVRMNEALHIMGRHDEKTLDAYLGRYGTDNLRVTMIDTCGQVVYDSSRKDYENIGNHRLRKEVAEAVRTGEGFDINRLSQTVDEKYVYSATYFRNDGYVLRSALPYTVSLAQSLKADQMYIWIAVGVILVLSVFLYRFVDRLDKTIAKLRIFAGRAERNESLDTEDLVEFPDDELGELSEYIIKLYKRVQKTKEEQNVLKRQLTQNVAHELKTPVASIQGYLETILSKPDMPEETYRQFLDRCYAQSKRLGSLLSDISTLNRLDEAPEMMAFETLDISNVVAQIERETQLELKKRSMTFRNRLPQHVMVEGNPSMVYSVFRNLTDNAISYAGEGTEITVGATESEDGKWHFVFSDNGVGVGREHLQRIFERFYRIDKGRSRKLGGTGLGLAIVKNAVLLHGGSISASNADGGGLRFDFTMPKR